MRKEKLPHATDWKARTIDDWNCTTFKSYLIAKHLLLFGIDYVPMGGRWDAEQGIIGGIIGTSSRKSPKPRKAPNEALKRFIDVTFESYQPTDKYPGTSLGFMWTYRKADWQRIQAELLTQTKRDIVKESEPTADVLAEWW